MQEYIIATDADSELPWQYAEEQGIAVFHMPFAMEGTEYNYDLGKEVKIPNFFQRLSDGANVTTSCRPPWEIKDFFKQYTDQGLAVLYIGFSHAMSNHYNNCEMAKNMLLEESPDAVVELVDTLSISLGQSQLVMKAVEMKKNGATIDEAANWVRGNIQNSLVFFAVDDLNYLRRGGRVSGASAFFGTVLDIKPILHTSEDGKLVPIEKVKGKKKAMRRLAEFIKERGRDIENSTVLITAADPIEGNWLKNVVEQNFNPKEVLVWEVGPVIGGHAGPGTIGISFFGSHR